MRNETRKAFNDYLTRQAQLNGVDSGTAAFTVSPSVQQTLEDKIQESSEFLGKINIVPVVEQSGEKLGLGVSGPAASRTDTAAAERQTRDLHTLEGRSYQCEKTNFDTHIKYATLDAWAKFSDFQLRVRNQIIARQALDRIMIGFNGTSVAANTNIATNPLLQDVNKGWLQHLREDAPVRVMTHGATAGKVTVGAAGDYKNIDALVFDAIRLLEPWFHNNPHLVCMLGRNLLDDKYFPLVNVHQAPTETLAADIVISQKRVGGLQAATVPFFPDNTLLITTYDNLSVYWQEGARRRRLQDNPKRDRVENYESSNDAYVVENYGLAAMVSNIEIAA